MVCSSNLDNTCYTFAKQIVNKLLESIAYRIGSARSNLLNDTLQPNPASNASLLHRPALQLRLRAANVCWTKPNADGVISSDSATASCCHKLAYEEVVRKHDAPDNMLLSLTGMSIASCQGCSQGIQQVKTTNHCRLQLNYTAPTSYGGGE